MMASTVSLAKTSWIREYFRQGKAETSLGHLGSLGQASWFLKRLNEWFQSKTSLRSQQEANIGITGVNQNDHIISGGIALPLQSGYYLYLLIP